jgi:hypothetical protein
MANLCAVWAQIAPRTLDTQYVQSQRGELRQVQESFELGVRDSLNPRFSGCRPEM